jgi:hypothetical protein
MATGTLTDRALRALKPGKWVADTATKGAGSLQARRTTHGVTLYHRYPTPGGKSVRLPIGAFDPAGRDGLSLAQARARVGELSKRFTAGTRDLRAALTADAAETKRALLEAERAAVAEAMRERGTLGMLLGLYADDLKSRDKPSWRGVRNTCLLHVRDAHPVLWNTPAANVTIDDLIALLSPLIRAKKLREAAKLRSHIRAAFRSAIRARQDPQGVPAMRALGLTSDPAATLATIEGASNARDRALSVAELRAYWHRIAKMPGPAGAALRFHLLTGAQRVEQLARLTVANYDSDSQTVRLRDPKGRRKVARIHDVPLIPEAIAAMQAMRGAAGPYLQTVTQGATPAAYATLRPHLRTVVDAMAAAGELEKGRFTLGDLRRTVETRLAGLGISSDTRAQLQSHGLGGIQARHYDRHDYLPEKLAALEALHRLATGTVAKVTTLRRAKA